MPPAPDRAPRRVREVVFVDGVRTPFGKAGPSGMYAETRADDLVIKCIRELLRRNPGLPPERVDDVAVAATTQTGDQGLTIGRMAALLSGLPPSVPGYAIDRMCAGAMTAVTTTAAAIGVGAYDVVIAGGVEHMGHHPMGDGVDPNPRFVAERLVDPSALVMGQTAENLHDRFPELSKTRADAYAAASQAKLAEAYQRGVIQRDLVPIATRNAEAGWGLAHPGRASPPGHHGRGPGRAEDPVPPARTGHRRQRRRAQRRSHRLPARRGGHRGGAGPAGEDADGLLRLRRGRAGGDGGRADPGHREGPGQGRAEHGRHRPDRDQRGLRRTGAGLPGALRHRR